MAIVVQSSRAPSARDLKLAAGCLAHVRRGDAAALAQQARAAGMQSVGTNAWQARDKSWIRLNANGTIDRGVGTVQFTGIPGRAAQPARPAAAARPAPSPARRASPTQTTPGTLTAQHMKTTALARAPMMRSGNASTWASQLRALGFAQSGDRFSHADGSLVDFRAGSPSLSYKGVPLGQLPRWW